MNFIEEFIENYTNRGKYLQENIIYDRKYAINKWGNDWEYYNDKNIIYIIDVREGNNFGLIEFLGNYLNSNEFTKLLNKNKLEYDLVDPYYAIIYKK